MTLEDLNQRFYLDKLIGRKKRELECLRDSAMSVSHVITGLPHRHGPVDRIGETVPDIVDKEREIETEIEGHERLLRQIDDYIASVPFARVRLILTLRFIDGMTWEEVAENISGKETEYSVKQACYRYIKSRQP